MGISGNLARNSGISDKTKATLASIAAAGATPAPMAVKVQTLGPTPEQMRKGNFNREGAKTKNGQVNGIAYRREPLFEELAKRSTGIDDEGLRALRFYRDRHEATAMSLTRCALDIEGRGGGGLPMCLPPGIMADYAVTQCEAAIGAVVDTLRAVALEDQSFSQVAIARFGSRRQSWIEQEKHRGRTRNGGKMAFVEKIVPKSGRHREIIRDEFLLGLARLTVAVRFFTTTDRPAVPRVEPAQHEAGSQPACPAEVVAAQRGAVAAEYLDESGFMLPWEQIAAIIRERVLPPAPHDVPCTGAPHMSSSAVVE